MVKKILDFDEAYKIMEEAFPVSEIRPYEKLKTLFEQEVLSIYGYYDTDLQGTMILWQDQNYLVIENFAVDCQIRGAGIGSKMLQAICEKFAPKTIVLEVEQPYDEISEKRIKFYERNGFVLSEYGYEQPKINTEVNKIPLLLMVYEQAIDESKFVEIKAMIFDTMYDKRHGV